jgi:N-acetylmuramoyl-L-alanine amidase
MIGVVALVLVSLLGGPSPDVPRSIVIATSRGENVVPVSTERGHPALAAPQLAVLLPITTESEADPGWVRVRLAGQQFRFLLDAPVFTHLTRIVPLAGGAYIARDTVFVPLQWLATWVPRVFTEAYRWDPLAARFEEAGLTPVMARVSEQGRPPDHQAAPEAARRLGLRFSHRVVVDAGHGGKDPGNPGRYLPRGMKEKHVTLGIALDLQETLESRGVEVIMTRTGDTYPDVYERAPMCREDCDLFVSVHVNSLGGGKSAERVRGVETYFFDQAQTADAERVAAMENEFLRYESDVAVEEDDALGFILKDLQRNEYLRESAQLAEIVQERAGSVHPGGGRKVAQARFIVLRVARRPAILVEVGYATNPQDGRYLASPAGQRELAIAIADGVIDYLLRYETKTALPASR